MRFYYRNLLDKNNDYNILLPLGHVDNVETSDWHTIVTIGGVLWCLVIYRKKKIHIHLYCFLENKKCLYKHQF